MNLPLADCFPAEIAISSRYSIPSSAKLFPIANILTGSFWACKEENNSKHKISRKEFFVFISDDLNFSNYVAKLLNFFYRRFKNRYFFRSCFKFIPRQIETYVEADWSPRYAVNSGLLTKIKGF